MSPKAVAATWVVALFGGVMVSILSASSGLRHDDRLVQLAAQFAALIASLLYAFEVSRRDDDARTRARRSRLAGTNRVMVQVALTDFALCVAATHYPGARPEALGLTASLLILAIATTGLSSSGST